MPTMCRNARHGNIGQMAYPRAAHALSESFSSANNAAAARVDTPSLS